MKKEFQEKDALDRQVKGFKQVTNRFWVSMMYSVMMYIKRLNGKEMYLPI